MTLRPRAAKKPFPGLRPFEPDEEHLFFGRELQIDELLSRLRSRRFVAVVGASGSGKSSLVRAGLLPALYGGLMVSAGPQWYVALMRPGRTPVANLTRALQNSGVAGQQSGDPVLRLGLIQAVLERGALGLVEFVADTRLGRGENLLVIVDQFEELFRFKAVDAAAFVKLLLAATAQQQYPIHVVMTMRSDFLGDVSQFRSLPEVISASLFLVPRLTRAQFHLAIEGPVRVAGGSIAPRLTTRLLNDLEDDVDQLPVLQHALMRTWSANRERIELDAPLDIADLDAIGGLSEALSRHGDEVYSALPTDRLREVAERVFRCLTDPGDDNRGVRRPTRFAALCAVVDADPSQVRQVVDAFRAPECCFLMPSPTQPIDDDTVIDISHESLMRIWTRLQHWVDDEAQSAQIYSRVAIAASLYEKGRAAYWRDPDLQIALRWRELNRPTAAWGERIAPGFNAAMRFLNDSSAERSRERRQRTIRSRATLAALVAVAVALAVLTLVAFSQWRVADISLRTERAERLSDASLQEPIERGTAALLAADAYGVARTPRTMGAMLQQVLRLNALRGIGVPFVTGEAFAQHGRLLAAVTKSDDSSSPKLSIFNALNLAFIARGPLSGLARVAAICGSFDGDWFAVTDGAKIELYQSNRNGAPSRIQSWTLANVERIACLPGPPSVLVAGAGNVRVLNFGRGSETKLRLPGGGHTTDIAASPQKGFFASMSAGGGDGNVGIFDVSSGRQIAKSDLLHEACAKIQRCNGLAFNPNGTRLAWIDGPWLRSADVPGLTNVTSRKCDCHNAVLAYGADGSGPKALELPGDSGFAYDPNTETLATHGRRGITEYARDGSAAPALGSQPAPLWPGSFASTGNLLILAGSSRLRVYNLDEYRAALATADDVSRRIRLIDPQDGVHLISFNYENGAVGIFVVRDALKQTATIRVRPTAESRPSDAPEIGYDPIEQAVTEASADGIARYSTSGTMLGTTPWQSIASRAGLSGWLPAVPSLSARGTYVRLVRPPFDDLPSATPQTIAVVPISGGFTAQFVTMPTITQDERFVIGLRTDDLDGTAGVYRLPAVTRLAAVQLPETQTAAISPNARMIAYATTEQPAHSVSIQLLDVATGSRIGPALPPPPYAQDIDNLAFTDNSRFLLASYRLGTGRHLLVVYSVDPNDWERTLCLWAGRLDDNKPAERPFQADACTKYAAEMPP